MDRLKEIWQHPTWKETPVLLLYGDEDQYVPSFVGKEDMIHKWKEIHGSQISKHVASKSLFKVLEHANHELSDERFFLY
jgi:alpha-beta hydrolase superfamily lysophospholipase